MILTLQMRTSSTGNSDQWCPFLCPRCRAGLCDEFQYEILEGNLTAVSMPSVSGRALRRMAHKHERELRLCEPSRQPYRERLGLKGRPVGQDPRSAAQCVI